MTEIRPGDYINDIYAPLNGFAIMRDAGTARRFPALAGQWLPRSQMRRLTAYQVLDAMRNNAVAQYLDGATTEHREYGDANRIVQRTVDGIVSEEMAPFAPAAVEAPPAAPILPDRPDEPGEDASDLDKRIYQRQLARWQVDAAQAVTAWEEAWPIYDRARHVHTEANQWWLRQRVTGKLRQSETDGSVTLGDGVLVLGIVDGQPDPVLRVYEPDAYFPDLAENGRDYPTTVRFVWEEKQDEDAEKPTEVLFKHVYEVLPIVEGGDVVFDAAGRPSPVMKTDTIDDTVHPDGNGGWEIRRVLPWHAPGEYTTTACMFSAYEWEKGDAGDWNGLDESRTRAAVTYRADLGYDEVPVVHVPNEEDSANHFGRSVLLHPAQLLVDVGQSDRDNLKASQLAALPIATTDTEKDISGLAMQPGRVWPIPAETLDMSGQLDALFAFNEKLRDRLGTVSGVNAVVLGTIDRDIAGITLKLLLGPFEQMIATLRITRQTKYSVLLKLWQRMAMITGQVEGGATVPLEVAFGPITPTDAAAVIEQVTALLDAKAVSRVTGLRMLIGAGLPIDDAEKELAAIASTDFEGANLLSAALDDERPSFDYLGVPPPEPAQPVVDRPGFEL